MYPIALHETNWPVAWGSPEEAPQVESRDVSRQLDSVHEAPVMGHRQIESDFLQGILLEQAELSWANEAAHQSEWFVFLKNLKPDSPRDHTDLNNSGLQKDQGRPTGESVSEWDTLLAWLSQIETTVVQKILGHVESDVLQGMLRYLHLRVLQDHRRENHCEDSMSLPLQHVAFNKAQLGLLRQMDPNPVEDEPEAMHSIPNWNRQNQIDSDIRPLTTELNTFECPRKIDWQGRSHENALQRSVDFVWKETVQLMHWDLPRNAIHQLDTELQEDSKELLPKALQGIEQHQSAHRPFTGQLMHWDMPRNPTHQLDTELDGNSKEVLPEALQGIEQQQEEQNLLRNLSQRCKPDLDEVCEESTQRMESKPKVNSQESHTIQNLADPDFRQKRSQQINSKLAEIPSQIACTLLTRSPQEMDSNVLHQLFKQIDKILLQVMPQQMSSSESLHPLQLKDHLFHHVDWNVPQDYSLRDPDEYFGYSELDQMLPIPQQHQLQSQYHKDLGLIPRCGQTQFEQMLWQRIESIDQQVTESSVSSSLNSRRPYSDMFEFTGATPHHLQLLPEFQVDASSTVSTRDQKPDAISVFCPLVDRTLHAPLIVRGPFSWTSSHPLLLDEPAQEEMIDVSSLQHIDSDQDLPQLPTPSSNVVLPEVFQYMRMELPQQQQEQDLVHLIPQSIIAGTFPQVDSRTLHALHQRMCLAVSQQISEKIEYNINQGIPLETDSGLAEVFSMNQWHQAALQPLLQETDTTDNYLPRHYDESWGVLEVDLASNAWPETSPHTEYSDEFRELDEDMDSTVDWITESSDNDSPRYCMAELIDKIHHHHHHYMDVDFERIGDRILSDFDRIGDRIISDFDKIGHTILSRTLANEVEKPRDHSAPDVVIPHRISTPLQLAEFEAQLAYPELIGLDDLLQEVSGQTIFNDIERSLDHARSLNLLQLSQVIPQQLVGDRSGHCIDFHLQGELDGLAEAGPNVLWIGNHTEPLNLAAILENQVSTTTVLQNKLMISDDCQVDDNDTSETSTDQVQDSNRIEELLLEGTDLNSPRTSESQESEKSTMFQDGVQPLETFAQPNDAFDSLQLARSPSMQDPQIVGQSLSVQQGKSIELNPQITSVQSPTELGGTGSSAPAFPQCTWDVHFQQRSETSEQEAHMNGERQEQANATEGAQQAYRRSDEEFRQEGTTSRWGKEIFPEVKPRSDISSRKSPTPSQFHDPSRPVRQTIFGLLVLAGGLYLVENRDQIEQQSISAAEAATAAWRWLGSFLLKMANGDFDN